ncbi:MAG TPA: polyprenyl synthetase family protein [Polyangiaceae bacterium]|jgi:geranylgeranyl diphosphate synthase type I|nr:polyprenyl synthetase family protein [Polyangiaceae bacterium]
MPLGTKSSKRARRRRPDQAKAIAPNPFAALVSSVQKDIDGRLEAFFDGQLELVAPHGPEVTAMVASLARLSLRGGKRLRPALLVAGYRVVSPKGDLEPALVAGLALELLHTYLLVHDDWMDGDALRRGGPTVHAELGKRFKHEHIGNSAAILAGDFASGVALEVLASVESRQARPAALFKAFAEMQVHAILGQQLDVAATNADPERAYALKTGSYTVRGPLRLGALLAGAKPATLKALDAYSTPVGIAFQLADDLLSAFGNPGATGKALGNDLRAGKRTPLVLEALRKARGRDRRHLLSAFNRPRASQAEVERALEVLVKSGAKKKTEARIEELLAQGLGALRSGMTRDGRELLEGAALALTARRV